MNVIDRLDADRPSFHAFGGSPANWRAYTSTLQYIAEHLGEGMPTLETGCGYTTVIFAASGANHICVTPSQAEADRVVSYCNGIGVSTENVEFAIGRSDHVLPTLDVNELEFIFVDGAHAFPYPVLDWHFAGQRLKIGGQIGFDNMEIKSCALVRDYLMTDPSWRFLAEEEGAAFFQKLGIGMPHDWRGQPFNTFPLYLDTIATPTLLNIIVRRGISVARLLAHQGVTSIQNAKRRPR